MAQVCASCGSADTGAMADTYVCHNCGAVTDYGGNLVAKETTDPTLPQPLAGSMSPVDYSDPDNPVRIVTTQGAEGPITQKVPADPDAGSRIPAVGSPEYDEWSANVGRGVAVSTPEGKVIVSEEPIVGSEGSVTQERDAPNPGVVGDTVDDGPIEPPLTTGMPEGSVTTVPDVGKVPTGPPADEAEDKG